MTGPWGVLFWVFFCAVLVVIEMSTVQLVCIWFAAGSLFAGLAAFVEAEFWLQLLIFLISSIAVLIVGRPLLVDRITPKKQATNADRVIGQLGIVLEEINNIKQTGRVSANGLDWTARSAYGEVIAPGTTILVLQIDGVKLIVQTLPQEEPPTLEPEPQPARNDFTPRPPQSEIYGIPCHVEPEPQPEQTLYNIPDVPPPPSIDRDREDIL